MEFTIYYRGPLKANGGAKEKHALRKHFHRQLKLLWAQKPLSAFSERMLDDNYALSAIRKIGAFRFAPLVTEKVSLIAELSISLLRPEPPGAIIVQSGDIDNRLKTLLDALKMPNSLSALPSEASPDDGEDPFFCLLEDDSLIYQVSIKTDRLLEPTTSPSEAIILIHVKTKHVETYMATIGLG